MLVPMHRRTSPCIFCTFIRLFVVCHACMHLYGRMSSPRHFSCQSRRQSKRLRLGVWVPVCIGPQVHWHDIREAPYSNVTKLYVGQSGQPVRRSRGTCAAKASVFISAVLYDLGICMKVLFQGISFSTSRKISKFACRHYSPNWRMQP